MLTRKKKLKKTLLRKIRTDMEINSFKIRINKNTLKIFGIDFIDIIQEIKNNFKNKNINGLIVDLENITGYIDMFITNRFNIYFIDKTIDLANNIIGILNYYYDDNLNQQILTLSIKIIAQLSIYTKFNISLDKKTIILLYNLANILEDKSHIFLIINNMLKEYYFYTNNKHNLYIIKDLNLVNQILEKLDKKQILLSTNDNHTEDICEYLFLHLYHELEANYHNFDKIIYYLSISKKYIFQIVKKNLENDEFYNLFNDYNLDIIINYFKKFKWFNEFFTKLMEILVLDFKYVQALEEIRYSINFPIQISCNIKGYTELFISFYKNNLNYNFQEDFINAWIKVFGTISYYEIYNNYKLIIDTIVIIFYNYKIYKNIFKEIIKGSKNVGYELCEDEKRILNYKIDKMNVALFGG